MKKMHKVVLFASVFIFIGLSNGYSKDWNLDKAHSGVMFEVDHIFSTIRGHFSEFDGDIRFDPNDLKNSRFNFTVKTESIDTYIPKRDSHLRSVDFFDTGEYPQMKFVTEEIKYIKGNEYLLKGKLTVKDITKEISVKSYYLGEKKHPLKKGANVAGFETEFKIDRLKFNVGEGKFYKMGVVGKDVNILVSIEVTD